VTARAARFVAKPVAVTELRHSIREALERGRMAGGTS
jgi:hypothetical protein